jgi:hypothetical protein
MSSIFGYRDWLRASPTQHHGEPVMDPGCDGYVGTESGHGATGMEFTVLSRYIVNFQYLPNLGRQLHTPSNEENG